jgi:hypothetical protein
MALRSQGTCSRTFRITPPDIVSVVRNIGLMLQDVVGLVRHLRKDTGD